MRYPAIFPRRAGGVNASADRIRTEPRATQRRITTSIQDAGPVDSGRLTEHIARVSKKPRKIEEAATPYAAKKPVPAMAKPAYSTTSPAPAIRYASPEQVRKAAEKVFKVHEELFRKLAQ